MNSELLRADYHAHCSEFAYEVIDQCNAEGEYEFAVVVRATINSNLDTTPDLYDEYVPLFLRDYALQLFEKAGPTNLYRKAAIDLVREAIYSDTMTAIHAMIAKITLNPGEI